MPKFCANLSMMFNEFDFPDRFAEASRAGFEGVEFLFPYAYPAEQIAEWLGQHELKQVLFNMPPGDWEAGERGLTCHPDRVGEFQENVGRTLEYATRLGCPRVHAMAGIVPEGGNPEQCHQTFVENLKFAARACEQSGVQLLIEPINTRDMPGYFLNTSRQAVQVLEEVCAPALRLQYDIYHMQIMEGDLAPTIERLRGQIGHMQLADTPGRHEPGTGEIHYPFLLEHIDRLGYSGWIGCEYRPHAGTHEGLGWIRPWLPPRS